MGHGFVVAGEGTERRRVPVGSALVIGRSPDCGLVIDDLAASRQHLEIRAADGGFVCRDLGSKNGTKINGTQTTACPLKHGDRIRIGDTLLRFEFGDAPEPAVPERTVFLQTVLDPAGVEQAPPPPSRSKELLEAAYTLMNAIATNFNPCDLVDTILRTTMDAIHAQRGAILFAGDDGRLRPCGVCGCVHTIRDGVPSSASVDDIKISESVARRVVQDGENVLYQFARTDDLVDATASIRALNLTSILCVPIRTQSRTFGILYVDTDIANHKYTEDDLLLAAAAGNSAGLALENARIHQSLLEKHRIEQEIAAAWTIQEGFLVKEWPSEDRRFEVYGATQPAKTVGGDFYDFVELDSNRVALFIGDVSGKGVPAALMMAQVLAEFRLSVQSDPSPATVLTRLSERLVVRSRRGTFCTMCFVTVDLSTGRVVGANAGHHPVLLISDGQVTRVMDATGPPAGILPGMTWQDTELQLEPGDTLLLYTDGIVEARDGESDGDNDGPEAEYDIDRLERTAQAHGDLGPQALIEGILSDVHEFCRPAAPHDDCTMIALRYRGDGP
jgi:serine phosphatase RsbU (regulator of sigma subunit)